MTTVPVELQAVICPKQVVVGTVFDRQSVVLVLAHTGDGKAHIGHRLTAIVTGAKGVLSFSDPGLRWGFGSLS